MNMPFTDAAATGAVYRTDAARTVTSGSNTAIAEGSGNPNEAFQQLLSQIMGRGTNADTTAQGNPLSLLLLQGQLSMLNVENSEDLAQLLDSLQQSLDMLEQAAPELNQLLADNPQLLQLLITYMDDALANGRADATGGQASIPYDLQDIQVKLREVIRELYTKLTNGETSPELTNQAKAYQQLMQPILAAVHQQAHATRAGSHGHEALGAQSSVDVISSEESAPLWPRTSSASRADGAVRSDQDAELLLAPGKAETAASSMSTMLPRATLLRPDLLHLAMGEQPVEVSTEGKPAETVNTHMLPFSDVVKTAGDWTAARPLTPTLPQVPVGQFAEELNRFVFKSFQITQLNGMAEAKISLVPEHLGQVDIKLTMHNGQLTAQLVTETALGREMLEQQLGALRSALQSQGIQVDRLEVTQQTNLTSQLLKDHGQHQQSGRQYDQQPQSDHAPYEDDALDFGRELEMVGSEYDLYVNSRSFHATA